MLRKNLEHYKLTFKIFVCRDFELSCSVNVPSNSFLPYHGLSLTILEYIIFFKIVDDKLSTWRTHLPFVIFLKLKYIFNIRKFFPIHFVFKSCLNFQYGSTIKKQLTWSL